MDIYAQADRFEAFVQRVWIWNEQEGGDLFGYFQDWAMDENEGDLAAATNGNQAMMLQIFMLVVARFAQESQRFSNIRRFVTGLIDLTEHRGQLGVRLPGILDEADWNHLVFVRRYGGRFPPYI